MRLPGGSEDVERIWEHLVTAAPLDPERLAELVCEIVIVHTLIGEGRLPASLPVGRTPRAQSSHGRVIAFEATPESLP